MHSFLAVWCSLCRSKQPSPQVSKYCVHSLSECCAAAAFAACLAASETALGCRILQKQPGTHGSIMEKYNHFMWPKHACPPSYAHRAQRPMHAVHAW